MNNYKNQLEIQLNHIISLSTQNYVLHKNQKVVKSNDSFVHILQDLANHLRNAGETLERNSFEMIDNMSTSINDPQASFVRNDFSWNVGIKKQTGCHKF